MSKVEELFDIITLALDECDQYAYPHVCNMASNPETRKELEDTIIISAKESGRSVGQIIGEIERAYNPNMIDD